MLYFLLKNHFALFVSYKNDWKGTSPADERVKDDWELKGRCYISSKWVIMNRKEEENILLLRIAL